MAILHGAGSRKENHGDFARMCAAGGWAVISYDQRGHGQAQDEMVPAALGDVAKMARFLAADERVDPARICVRGSSMGGFWAIHAAATSRQLPARSRSAPLARSTSCACSPPERPNSACPRTSRRSLTAWLEEHDLREAAELMDSKPLIVLHAKGDERIPYDHSEQVAARKPDPKKLVILPGGHHRSIQHDPEIQSVALEWMARRI